MKKNTRIATATCLFGLVALAVPAAADPLGSAITYQGQLMDNGSPGSGDFDMEFRLYDALTGGNPIGPTLTFDGAGGNPDPVTVTDGLFTVELDFTSAAYDGQKRWLELTVAGTALTPRQELTPTPHARWANASASAGSVPWSGISGVPGNVSGAFSPWTAFSAGAATWGSSSFGLSSVPSGTFIAVAGGNEFSLGIRGDGTLTHWGDSGGGLNNVPSGTFAAVAAGNNHGLAIRSNGTLAGWGDNTFGQINVPSGTFVSVAAGFDFSLAVRSDGTLAGWGFNGIGQTNVPSGAFMAVTAGQHFGVGIRTDGTLAHWGSPEDGVNNVPAGTFIAVCAGRDAFFRNEYYVVAIRSDGTLVFWGQNVNGLGNVPSGTFTTVSAGARFAFAMRSDGTLAGWGIGNDGGENVPAGTYLETAAGYNHGLAIRRGVSYEFDVRAGPQGFTTTNGSRSVEMRSDGSMNAIKSTGAALTINHDSNQNVYLCATNGNVGIGTSSAGSKLTVAGDADVSGDVTIGTSGQHTTTEIHDNSLRLTNSLDSSIWEVAYEAGSPKYFYIDEFGNARHFVIMNSSGNVGIGTTSPGQKLQVNGSICATGTIGACSDARFKENVTGLTHALDQISQLRGVSFEWKRDEFCDRQFAEGQQVGFIAQEVENVLPQVVQTGSDGYRSVDYGRLTPLIVEAIKEIRADAERKLAEKDAQIAELQARLSRIEQMLSKDN